MGRSQVAALLVVAILGAAAFAAWRARQARHDGSPAGMAQAPDATMTRGRPSRLEVEALLRVPRTLQPRTVWDASGGTKALPRGTSSDDTPDAAAAEAGAMLEGVVRVPGFSHRLSGEIRAEGVLPGAGLGVHFCLLGPDGSWRLEGLQPGPYLVSVASLDPGFPYDEVWVTRMPVVLHAGVVESGRCVAHAPAHDVLLEVPCSWVEIEFPDGLPPYANAEGVLSDPQGRRTHLHHGRTPLWSDEVPSHTMALVPGTRYRLATWANGCAGHVEYVEAPAAGTIRKLPVRLPPALLGRLRVLTRSGACGHDLCLELRDEETGDHRYRAFLGAPTIDAPLSVEVPVGTWSATLTSWSPGAGAHGDLCLPQACRVEVSSSREVEVLWDPPLGGSFLLDVRCTAEGARHLILRVERDGISPRPTLVGSGSAELPRWSDEITTGAVYRGGDAYPPGEIVLHLEAEGCTPLRLPVRIVAGEVTSVQATLVALPGR